jgi:uncharacterized membrane protein YeaQ/YmgE (transglycosylase-associated protein family)
MSILWTIIIGFVAGVIAKFLYPGKNYEPAGFILTTVLGIVGAFVASSRHVLSGPSPTANKFYFGWRRKRKAQAGLIFST